MILNCVIAGVGGQGTVLMSRLIGQAALARGLSARGSETIGMAQRGGSVASHLRLSDRAVDSPLVPPGAARLVLALEPAEAARALPFLAPDGRLILLDRPIMPAGGFYHVEPVLAWLHRAGDRVSVLSADRLAGRCGATRALNVAVIAFAAARGLFPFGVEDLRKAVRERVAPAYLEINLRALEAGALTADEMEARS